MRQAEEVSTRLTAQIIDAFDAMSLDLGVIGVDEKVLRTPGGWVTFREYQQLLALVAEGSFDPESLRVVGQQLVKHSATTPFRHVGALMGGAQAMLRATYTWVLPANIRVVQCRCSAIDIGHAMIEMELDSDQPDGQVFFHQCAGSIEAMPLILNQDMSLVTADVHSHRARFDVRFAPSMGLAGRARRAWSSLTDSVGFSEAVTEFRHTTLHTLDTLNLSNERLAASEARWRGLTENLPGIVAVIDAQGQVEMHGGAEVDDVRADWFERLPTCEQERLRGLLEQVIAGQSIEDEVTVHFPEGQTSHWALRASAMPGDPPRAVVVAIDVSERRRAEQALLESERRLIEAQRTEVIARFAGGLAHDVNNMLAAVQGQAELLRLVRPDDAEVVRATEGILSAIGRTSGLTRRLLAYGSARTTNPDDVDLNHVVRGAHSLLERLLGSRVELELELDPHSVVAHVDPNLLEQALLNLVINARDALTDGGVIRIGTATRSQHAVLWVTDEGQGMTEEVLARAAEAFYTTKDPGNGTGLGLSTVQSLVRGGGGHMQIESALGEGTTVTLTLPMGSSSPTETPSLRFREAPLGQGQHILLIEDETEVRQMLSRTLVSLGYRVSEAPDGTRGLELLAADASVDLLLTDMIMPGLTGVQVARAAIELRPELPVLLVSGFSSEDPGTVAEFAEHCAFLAKPFARADLGDALAELLSDHRRRAPTT